ncbi:16S rRNA (cytosine(967)-C(5))-methyltransferase RsmB [Crenobacter cavernae]|uniref:16S rRNA (cytosine(967)-C(5))-methyltransferase n=1 Tax=Crenobacter cavernae TaxID=2290923 RepID=A0ABY0FEC5_9NEIS|nr:16S rRNA (cytosine(967)-C(5))-methyltransferase RsmB [Crenobacter cavernae]RXZ44579.1 16S rRNA (cytosine(967)-C(5))-methyltransferase RsmB [Crenobacter cavernae]
MSSIQTLAAHVLARIDEGRTLTDALAEIWQRHPDLPAGNRAALQDLAYGSVRRLAELRFILRQLVPRALPEPALERLLTVAIYQLAYTRTAPYAVVDTAVTEASKFAGGRFKGLANGTLRNFQRQQDELLTKASRDLEAGTNHPRWWVDKLKQAFPKQWLAIVEADNSHPPMTLRVNRRHADADAYLATLAEAGLDAEKLSESAVRLARPLPVRELPGFADGVVSVQDFGAQQAAIRLDVKEGQRVLDACAAPGGKTGHILELADVDLTALDVDAARLKRVEENLDRLRLSATLKAADAAQPGTWWDGVPFDRILADVPCSASGVVRRHPDIKWLRRPGDFAGFARQQAAMLDALWPCLASGGKMLYATCSIFPEENRQQLAAFLTRHPDASHLGDEALIPCERHDGFYYALLEKR